MSETAWGIAPGLGLNYKRALKVRLKGIEEAEAWNHTFSASGFAITFPGALPQR
jgi:hypothetical protein